MLSHTTRQRLALFRKQPSRQQRDKISAYTANHANHSFLASPPLRWWVFALHWWWSNIVGAISAIVASYCTNYLERRLIKAINWGPLDKRGARAECNSKSGRFAHSLRLRSGLFSLDGPRAFRALDGVRERIDAPHWPLWGTSKRQTKWKTNR